MSEELLTPRQRETYLGVQDYMKKHGVGIKHACDVLGMNTATYGNAARRVRYGTRARWSGGSSSRIVPIDTIDIATDDEAFSCDDGLSF